MKKFFILILAVTMLTSCTYTYFSTEHLKEFGKIVIMSPNDERAVFGETYYYADIFISNKEIRLCGPALLTGIEFDIYPFEVNGGSNYRFIVRKDDFDAFVEHNNVEVKIFE